MYTLNWQPPYDWSWMLGFLAACGERRGNGRGQLLCP